jgi:hypothetical protein
MGRRIFRKAAGSGIFLKLRNDSKAQAFRSCHGAAFDAKLRHWLQVFLTVKPKKHSYDWLPS